MCRAEVVLLGCWWQQYQGRLCRPTRVEGKGNSNFVLHTREVHHSESVSQWFLLEVEEPSNGNLLKGAFTKYFKEGFVVHGKKQVTAAQYKELCFVHRLGQITFMLGSSGSQCLPLQRVIEVSAIMWRVHIIGLYGHWGGPLLIRNGWGWDR